MSASDARATEVLRVLRELGGWHGMYAISANTEDPHGGHRIYPIPPSGVNTRLKQLEAVGLVESRVGNLRREWKARP